MMKKGRLIEELEEIGIIDKNASIGAKHSQLKGLNSISIAGSDNPLVEVKQEDLIQIEFKLIIQYIMKKTSIESYKHNVVYVVYSLSLSSKVRYYLGVNFKQQGDAAKSVGKNLGANTLIIVGIIGIVLAIIAWFVIWKLILK